MYLRLQDFKTVSEYNSTLFKISSQLKLCGEKKITKEDILKKTFTTFHASNVLLQQQYRECIFTKSFELISCLLVTKQNNEFLMRNHQSRPTTSKLFLELKAISSQLVDVDKDEDVVMVIEGIPDTIALMVIIL